MFAEHDGDGDGPEGHPDQQREQAARLLEELQLGRSPADRRRPRSEPSAEGRDEAVAVQGEGAGVGEQGQGQDGDAGEGLGGGPVPARQPQQPPAPGPGRGAHSDAEEQLEGGAAGALGVLQAGGGGRAGDGQHHDGGGDAVVEAALDRDELADP